MGAPVDIVPGRVIGGYRVERTLGRGGMSTVYAARDLMLAREVALKVISPDLAADGVFVERFRAESRIAASLEHPAVVPVYDAGEADGAFYIAMRLVRGRDLRTLLGDDGPLRTPDALALLRPVAEALDAAHALGLVHRDVKPANILVGDDGSVYLSDFGLAKATDTGSSASLGGSLVGTVEYVSPEQIRGETIDGRADQYSLACVLFECVAGRTPFARESELATLWAHVEDVAPLPSALGVRVPPTLDEAVALALAKAREARFRTCIELLDMAGRRTPRLPRPGRAPYKGLGAFDEADSPYFFGRERLVAELASRVEEGGFTALVGSSGSGKSSLLRAGLLPALALRLPDVAHVVLRPGSEPTRALRDAVTSAPAAPQVVIAVDQLEEMFTACADEHDRGVFAEALAAAAGDPTRAVVVTLRADFFGHAATYPALAKLLGARTVLIGPMSREELIRAVEGPAARAGLTVERGLAEALVEEAGDGVGALPLLSTALLELWRRRDGSVLTLRAHRETGGVRAAVGRLAEETYARLDAAAQDAARHLLLRLVDVGERGEPVGRRVPLSELDPHDTSARAVIEAFTASRLVTVDDGAAEVSHEALFREWPRLRGWLDDDVQGRAVHRRLTAAAGEWKSAGRDPADLLRGARLASTLEWEAGRGDKLNEIERSYLAASREAADRDALRARRANRRLRALLAIAALLLAAVSVAVVVALRQRSEARRSEVASEVQRLAALSRSEPRLDRSLLLARQATALSEGIEARSALHASLLRAPAAVRMLRSPVRRPVGLAAAAHGHRLLVWNGRHDGALVDASSGRVVARIPFERGTFSDDGRRAILLTTAAVRRLDARTGKQLRTWRWPSGAFRYRAVAPGGNAALAVARDGRGLVVWDTRSSRVRLRLEPPSGEIFLLARFAPHGRIVTADLRPRSGSVTYAVWAPGRTPPVATTPGTDAASAPALSGEGRLLAWRSHDARSVAFADLAVGRTRTTTPLAKPVASIAVAPDGRAAATGGEDGVVRLWDAATARELESFSAHRAAVRGVSFGDRGRTLYTASADGTIVAWDVHGGRGLGHPFVAAGRAATRVAAAPSGDLVAAADADGVAVTDAGTLRRVARLRVRGGARDVAFGTDGRLLATAGPSLVTVWDTRTWRRVLSFPVAGGVAVAFALDGTVAAATSTGQVLTRPPNGRRGASDVRGAVADLAFAPKGEVLAVALNDPAPTRLGGFASVLDARTLARLYTVNVDSGYGRSAAVAFSPDGRVLATGGGTGEVRFFDPSTGRRLGRVVLARAGWLSSVDFSGDGRTLAVGTATGGVRLVDVAARAQIGPPLPARGGDAVSAVFSADGTRLFAVDRAGRGVRWDIGRRLLERRACAVAGRTLTRDEWERFLPGRAFDPACG